MMQNKPWKSFAEQLTLLEGRGLVVDNKTAALDYLGRIGYYRLSGYWYSFREVEITQNASSGKLVYERKNTFICQNSSWGQRFAELMAEFPEVGCGAVSVKDFGLLENWQDWYLWK